jgi:alpha-glucosidase
LLKFIPIVALTFTLAATSTAQQHELVSPDGRISVQIKTGQRLTYDLLVNKKPVLRDSSLSIDIDHKRLGANPRIINTVNNSVDREFTSPVPLKSARVRERYRELRLEMEGNYTIVFRMFNEGMAYRIETSLPQDQVKVYEEEVQLRFAANYTAYFPKEDSFFSHNERAFMPLPLQEIKKETLASLPALIVTDDNLKLLIAESDIDDYPGLWLRGDGDNSLNATFPPYPLKEELRRDRNLRVSEAADYIAVTKGRRTFPWRILAVAEKDADLLTNQMVFLLASPSQIADTSWIRPGKVAWDWYNANNLYGVDFKAGINTQTYKHFIDFASKYGIEYVILDEGWYKLGNVLDVVPEMNIEELVAYGKQKKVGIILWVVWNTLDKQLEAALNQYEKWGVKGIKVDFMQRDDQPVMNYYHRVCREAAKRKLLVDFHGAIRPATLTRTWPNMVNTEGVHGLENNKWAKTVTPEHNVTLPFTRMFMGPMDYTPGAMLNSGAEKNFAIVFERPMSLGTRAHQLSMYVVYESPLQMLADSPSHYLREPEVMEFLGPVPSVWDETRVLDAKLGDYVLIARRRGTDWYVGAMTDWTAREMEVDFSFLGKNSFRMTAFADGPNAARSGSDYHKTVSTINNGTKLKIKLESGGGWAARIVPARNTPQRR